MIPSKRAGPVACWAFALFVQFVGAATPTLVTSLTEYNQRVWSHEQGLPDDRVWSILQTQDGYMWFATERGLARFDGAHFTVFNQANTPGFLSDTCLSMAEDTDKNLWISTGAGLLLKANNTVLHIGPTEGLPKDYPSILRPSHGGGIWSFWNGYLSRVARPNVTNYYDEKGLSDLPILALEEAEAGRVWLGGNAGLFRFDPQENWFQFAPLGEDFERLPVAGICPGQPGEMWMVFTERVTEPATLGPKAWLACVRDGKWVRKPNLNHHDFLGQWRGPFLVIDHFGALWMPGPANALTRFEKNQIEVLPMPHNGGEDFAIAAFPDREGNVWVGTEGGGVQRWTPRTFKCYSVKDGLANDNTWCICQGSHGDVLIGSDGGVNSISNGVLTNLYVPAGRDQEFVRSIAQTSDGSIWIGTMRSLFCYNQGRVSEHRLPGPWEESKIRALLPGRAGGLWVGTACGLTFLEKGRRRKYTREEGLGADDVRALLQDRGGDLWIGTLGGGLSRLHDGHFTTLTETNGLCSNNVWSLCEDADGAIWIGTESGLNRLRAGVLSTFTIVEGLPDNQINCVLDDDNGRLWIGWDHGIYWVKKSELDQVADKHLRGVVAVRYDQSDGLLSAETNGQKSNPAACKMRDGRLWFATTKGVAVVDPARIIDDEVSPLAVIEQVRANGEIMLANSPNDLRILREKGRPLSQSVLKLPAGGARVLEFRYTASSFVEPEKIQFRYRLLGLDNHWIECDTRREAYFTDLPSGDYRFEVASRSRHGVWQRQGAFLPFHVASFYYQRWWFYTGCGGFTIGIAALGVGWRLRELRKIHRLEQLNALNEQRKQIARDIHDELGASLTHILQLSNQTGMPPDAGHPVDTRSQRIASIAGEAVDNIGEIVWATNPEYDTLEDLVAYIREYAANLFADSGAQIRFDFPDCVPERPATGMFRRHLLLLVKEGLQNVMKHAKATEIQLRLNFRLDGLELCLTDNGRGWEGNSATRGNGLLNMRHRVSELKGALELKSEPGKGTELRLVIPWQ